MITSRTEYPGTRCRRVLPRLDVHEYQVPAQLSLGSRTIPGTLLNLSLGGCAICIGADVTDLSIEIGSTLGLTLPTITTIHKKALACDVELVDAYDGVLRLQFFPLSLPARHALTHLVHGLGHRRMFGPATS